jgi:single-stranded-DNA-specific exonuclease
MAKKWQILKSDKEKAKLIRDEIKVPDIVARTLVNRGIVTADNARKYANPNILDLHNPFHFHDIDKAIERIERAVSEKKGILIFGDRDVDGVTATAILYKILQKMGANVVYRVPEGEENYGISRDVIAWAVENYFELMITVDCGITAIEEIDYAGSLNLDVIITDHHEPRDKLPNACAIINPKVGDDGYPFKYLCGAGVVFKLAQAIVEKTEFPEYYGEEMVFLDLETTGLNPNHDEIIEIGAVKMRNGIKVGEFQTLVKTSFPIPIQSTQIHGITNEMVEENGIDIKEALAKFMEFIGESKIIGHNIVMFDLKFLDAAMKKHFGKLIKNTVEDTLKMARVMLRKLAKHDLASVAEHLGVCFEHSKLHRSVADSEVCASIYRRLLLSRSARINDLYNEYLPLVAIGTIADIMPLIDENRNIVKNGMKMIPYSSIGLISLIRESNLNMDTINSKTISWNIAPLLNSPGRVGEATLSVELLITNKVKEAEALAREIIAKDKERKNMVHNLDKAVKELDMETFEKNNFLFFSSEKIPRGITGLLANRLSNEYSLPAIVISGENDEVNGSVRASGEFDVVSMLTALSGYLLQYGGHRYAGGFTIKKENINEFYEKVKEYMTNFDRAEFEENIVIDDVLEDFDELTISNLRYLENILEPFGNGNETPNYLIQNLKIQEIKLIGKNNNHVLITAVKGRGEFSIVGWNCGQEVAALKDKHTLFDIVGYPEINKFQGNEEARLILADIKGR